MEDESLDGVYILFPDPWPKARHHKRRIINQDMLALIDRVLKKNGELNLATDHMGYAQWMLAHLNKHGGFEFMAEKSSDWKTPPKDHFTTRYEEKQKAGKPVYLGFVRK